MSFVAGYFGLEIMSEILILAILALSLDMVAGFGGMVSLAHGALMGLGAYGYAIFSVELGLAPGLSMLLAVLSTGVLAWIMGAVCAGTHGVYLMMVTLAFGQMAYTFVFESPLLGGDDGMSGMARPDLSFIGVDLSDSRSFVLYLLVLTLASYAFAALVLRSGLGRSLVGIKDNETRMKALGQYTWKIKAHAFGLSGAVAGLAGVLTAQHIMFISPSLLNWVVSGEALIVMILGGLGTLVGSIFGAAAFVFIKHEVSNFTPYWHLVMGLVLIAVVMSGANGIFGSAEAWLARRRRRKSSAGLQVKETKDA